MKSWAPSTGQFVATLTAFKPDGSVNLAIVDEYVQHLLDNNVRQIFLNGTTGEHASLTVQERKLILDRYLHNGKFDRLIAHIGGNHLADSIELAAHAELSGVECIACVMPAYFKPYDLDALVEYCHQVAAAAPDTPFMYYHIPSVTGIKYPCHVILRAMSDRIPTLVGAKFTSTDLVDMTKCLTIGNLDILIGAEAIFVGAWAMGCRAAIGVSFSVVGKRMDRMIKYLAIGNYEEAMRDQVIIQQMIDAAMPNANLSELIASFKYAMGSECPSGFGLDFGEPRLPNSSLDDRYKLDVITAVKAIREL